MMLHHYVTIAFRNLVKYKVQSLISIGGLAIGLICCCYGWRWLKYETSYDNFYPEASNICMLYRFETQTGKKSEKLPLILARKLKQEFPEIRETAQIYSSFSSSFHLEERRLEEMDEVFVDENYFTLFPRPVICGRQENLLRSLDEIVITRSIAVRYFGSPEKALGKVLKNGYRDVLNIVAVVENAPANSLLKGDIYELDHFDRRMEKAASEERQWKLGGVRIYLLLHPDIDRKKFEAKINRYLSDHRFLEAVQVKAIPLDEVRHTLGTELTFNLSYIRTFTITGILLLLCVFFNFTNLLVNRIYVRNREMKLRNAIGAGRKQMILQLMVELTLLVAISIFLAFCLLELTIQPFSKIFETEMPRAQLFRDLGVFSLLSWALLAAVCLPLLLRFIRSSSLLVSAGTVTSRRGTFRKVSLTAQLCICIFFLMSTFIMFRQIYFMKHKDLGFKQEGLIELYMNYRDREGISRDISTLAQLNGFVPAGIFSFNHEPRTINDVEWEGKKADYSPHFQYLHVGADFPEVMGVEMVKGRFVDEGDLTTAGGWFARSTKAVINEEAVRVMGLSDPIGKTIRMWNFTTHGDGTREYDEMEIVGVIRDFQAASLRNPILPQIYMATRNDGGSATYFARTEPGREEAAVKAIRQVYKKHFQAGDSGEAAVRSMREVLRKLSTSEDASLRLFTLLALFCTLISIFGLYSISSSNMEQRRREIAVRKVMGAAPRTIIGMFFREYLVVTLVANAVALPLAWLFMHRWLEQYPYRISVGAWMYAVVLLFTVVLILCTVLYQTLRAARTNPARVIKSE